VAGVDSSPVDHGTRCHQLTHKGYSVLSDRAGRGDLPMVRDEEQTIATHLKDRRVIRIAQARRGPMSEQERALAGKSRMQ
jgi:hypothetical protein